MSEVKMLAETECGFRKWSIGVDENAAVKIKYSYYPGFVELILHDAEPNEFRKLANMFNFIADKLSKG